MTSFRLIITSANFKFHTKTNLEQRIIEASITIAQAVVANVHAKLRAIAR